MRIIALLLLTSPLLAIAALTPQDHPLFDGDSVHEFDLTFSQPNWWQLLEDNFEGVDDPPYLEAAFDWDGYHFDSIGVRFKGNSSYMAYPGEKKSFKFDIDEYVVGQEIAGLDKLNLNNCFLDPSFVREKCAYELADAAGLPAGRTNYVALTINGEYWGLYLLVEQVDQEFIDSRFGPGENGNLWKGEPHGSLEYLGAYDWNYYDDYELKTNEEVNDWSGLVNFCDQLNNTPIAELPDSMHIYCDVNSAMAMLAIDILTVNLDSYPGRCVNYYFYHRELDNRYVFLKWDMNEAWGLFNQYGYSLSQLKNLSIHWTNTQWGEERPLAEELWAISEYDDIYKGHLRRLSAGPAHPSILLPRMEELRDLVRSDVYSDTKKMFSNSEFESAMTTNIYDGPRLIPGLNGFVTDRNNYVQGQVGSWTPAEGLVINELMANNTATLADEMGDYDDWVEIYNAGPSSISLNGYALTDLNDGMDRYLFPAVSLDPGEYLIVWCDNETVEGQYHAPFKLDGDGEDLYLLDGYTIQDQVTFPALPQNLSYGRWPNGSGDWAMLSAASPGAENVNPIEPETITLQINEFLAVNTSGIVDEMSEFEDWLEIYNPGPEDVQMGGLFLSDDLSTSTQWAFPDTLLPAGEFMLVWCDSDENDGPLHTSFKLSSGGEEIGLFGRLTAGNNVIDSHVFGAQYADISEGREYDGAPDWILFTTPTPGASNGDPTSTGEELPQSLKLHAAWPNPFNPVTRISFELPEGAMLRIEVFDVSGRRVSTLAEAWYEAGRHEMDWHAEDLSGRELSSGVYLLRLSGDLGLKTQRLVLLR